MDKALEKDFKNIKTRSTIKRKAAKAFSIPKLMKQKLSNTFKNFISEETKKEYQEQKTTKVDEKIENKQKLASRVLEDTNLDHDTKNFYLQEIKKDYNKLLAKKAKISNKGLGVFALSKITFAQIKNNSNKIVNKIRAKREERARIEELESAKNEILENQQIIINAQNAIKNLINKYPELASNNVKLEEEQAKTL